MTTSLKTNYYHKNKLYLYQLKAEWFEQNDENPNQILKCEYCKRLNTKCLLDHPEMLYLNQFNDVKHTDEIKIMRSIANKQYKINKKIKQNAEKEEKERIEIEKNQKIVCDICMYNVVCRELKCKVCKKFISCMNCFTKFKNYELQLNPLIADYTENCMYEYSINCPHCRTKNNIPIQNFTKDDILKLTYKIFVDEKIIKSNINYYHQ